MPIYPLFLDAEASILPASVSTFPAIAAGLLSEQSQIFPVLVRFVRPIKSTLVLIYSGGATNDSASASLGGPVSTVAGGYIASQSYTASTIPGIQITHASRNPEGIGSLSYSVSSGLITWQPPNGLPVSSPPFSDGWLAIGTNTGGYLRLFLTISQLPTSDTTQPIAIADLKNTLFGKPTANDIIDGVTHYRALYLVNQSENTAENVKLVLTELAIGSDLSIGSTFLPVSTYDTSPDDVLNFSGVHAFGGIAPYTTSISPRYKRERLESLTLGGYPSMSYYPIGLSQNSDGVTTDIEAQIVDSEDSTGVLSEVQWGTSLYWSSILPGKMVSFWVRRVIPPSPTSPVYERVLLDFTFDIT